MEAVVVKAVTRELAGVLPARIQAVLQPSPREIVLALGGGGRHLLLSTDPAAARLHLLGARPSRAPAPTAFCRLLRKHLEGRVLAAAACPGIERVVTFAIGAPRDAGRTALLFVAELMGKHSNLILVDAADGVVVDALQHVAPPLSRVRTVLAGLPYEGPPEGGRLDPATLSPAAFAAIWRETGGEPAALFRRLLGIGPDTLAYATAAAGLDPAYADDPGAAVFAALTHLRETVERGVLRPTLYPERGVLLPLPVPGWEEEPHRTLPTMNEAAEAYFAALGAGREERRLREERGRRLGRELKKAAADEARLREEAGAEGRADLLQEAGTALVQSAADPPRGATSFPVPDPAGGPARVVALDPALGARQNAERLFHAARKTRRRARLAREKMPGVQSRRRLLEEELAALPALSLEDLGEKAPRRGGGGDRARAAPARREAADPGVREYRSAEGWRILVGKSDAGNDRLTGRIATPEDWWFHARDYPGAHVVLKAAGGEPPAAALRIAGEIAAWHSGARTEGMAEVSYTRRKHVRKVKGAPPGKVLLAQSSTLRVRPRVPDGVTEVKG